MREYIASKDREQPSKASREMLLEVEECEHVREQVLEENHSKQPLNADF